MTEPKNLNHTINLLVLFSLAAALHALITQLRIDAMNDWRTHIDLSMSGFRSRITSLEHPAEDAKMPPRPPAPPRVTRAKPKTTPPPVFDVYDHQEEL